MFVYCQKKFFCLENRSPLLKLLYRIIVSAVGARKIWGLYVLELSLYLKKTVFHFPGFSKTLRSFSRTFKDFPGSVRTLNTVHTSPSSFKLSPTASRRASVLVRASLNVLLLLSYKHTQYEYTTPSDVAFDRALNVFLLISCKHRVYKIRHKFSDVVLVHKLF